MPFYASNPQQYWMPKQKLARDVAPERPPAPKSPFREREAKPKPIPEGLDLMQAERFAPPPEPEGWQVDAARRLGRIGATLGDIDRLDRGWGQGYVAAGQVGDAAPVSSTTRFGTATFAPGTFMIGAADPSRREFLTQEGVRQSAQNTRDLANFMNINAPTGTRDNYGTTDPVRDAAIRATRADAATRENAAMGPLPEITTDDPMLVERAGGQAAYNAQKLAEARLAAAVSPVGQQATMLGAKARGIESAAGPAMSIDAGQDARRAFLEFLLGVKQQGATPEDIKAIMSAVGGNVTEEEVRQAMAAMTGGR